MTFTQAAVLKAVVQFAHYGNFETKKDHTKGLYVQVVTPTWWKSTKPFYGCIYLAHSNHQPGHTVRPFFLSKASMFFLMLLIE